MIWKLVCFFFFSIHIHLTLCIHFDHVTQSATVLFFQHETFMLMSVLLINLAADLMFLRATHM